MVKYVKKPIPVDAWQIDLLEIQNHGDYPDWVRYALEDRIVALSVLENNLIIKTLEGTMMACEGDYLLRGPKGEFWFNQKEIFEENYEEYDDSSTYNYSLKSGAIDLVDIEEQEDGSAILRWDLDANSLRTFAAIGVKKTLIEAANKIIEGTDE
jgi:hypothetical protein